MDDDVIDAPPEWDRTLLDAFERLPDVGYLAAAQVDDPNSRCAQVFHHESHYVRREANARFNRRHCERYGADCSRRVSLDHFPTTSRGYGS